MVTERIGAPGAHPLHFSLVAMNDTGKPTLVALLRAFFPDERRRYTAAEVRKAMRREMEQRFGSVR